MPQSDRTTTRQSAPAAANASHQDVGGPSPGSISRMGCFGFRTPSPSTLAAMESIGAGELVKVADGGPEVDGIVFDTPSSSKIIVAVIDRARGPVFRTVHASTVSARTEEGPDDRALRLLFAGRRRPSTARREAGAWRTGTRRPSARSGTPPDRQVARRGAEPDHHGPNLAAAPVAFQPGARPQAASCPQRAQTFRAATDSTSPRCANRRCRAERTPCPTGRSSLQAGGPRFEPATAHSTGNLVSSPVPPPRPA